MSTDTTVHPEPTATRISPRDRDTILASLRAGVVPVSGFQHIQVGRVAEITALGSDISRTADGSSAVRFVVGEYGAGKTFLLTLTRALATSQGLLAASTDLDPSKRLAGGNGASRALYASIAASISTRSQPAGGALRAVVEQIITRAVADADASRVTPGELLADRLRGLHDLTLGFDAATVLRRYWDGYDNDKPDLCDAALRWLRGEFTTVTEARAELGVRRIITDGDLLPGLRLLTALARLAGHHGLLVTIDEMTNLLRLVSQSTRQANYEALLALVNELLQGTTPGLMVVFGSTNESVWDTHRGLASYDALATRLKESRFTGRGIVDTTGPILNIPQLTPEDLVVLLQRLRHLHAGGDQQRYAVTDAEIVAYVAHAEAQLGGTYYRSPRLTIKDFLDCLAALEQNDVTWDQLLDGHQMTSSPEPSAVGDASDDGDDLAAFRL